MGWRLGTTTDIKDHGDFPFLFITCEKPVIGSQDIPGILTKIRGLRS
jgi:hypothetical protein